ncbi:cytochrome P450 [Streptomyces longispororuber]|uniref:cytochrome P450 n=1 Tax=Streptomyces longispororuber TaxID=68230 RepID=UPI00210AADC4|nr:cytochrome P450 [Streptomyces longispororuber]MCQ4209139.1 cytochrome P450 [Streptomyces longispororuber]
MPLSPEVPDSAEAAGPTPLAYPFEQPPGLAQCPMYAHLREEDPVAQVRMPSGDRAFLLTRYEDVRTALSDPRFSRAATLEPGAPRLAAAPQNFKSLLNMDPPEHTRVRKLVSREFTARRVAALRPRIQEHTDALLDAMAELEQPVDLVPALAFQLPVTVICELLGVPFEDRDDFAAWSRVFLATTSVSKEEMLASQIALRTYLAELVAAKRENPGDDLLSALVSIHDEDGDRLQEEELIFLGISLLVAGHETTVNQIANSVVALLTHPEQLERLRKDPDLINSAVEELLRLHPPGNEALLRITLEDVELGDVTIPKGSAVLPSLSAANRDVRQYENPDSIDFDRPANPHFAFSHGTHYCIGSGLARAELQIAIGSLIERFPTLRLAVAEDELRRPEGMLVHGIASLPVTW